MGLIIEAQILHRVSIAKGVSPFYLNIPKDRLSKPFGINPFSNYFVSGILLDVVFLTRPLDVMDKDVKKALDFARGKAVEFKIYVPYVGNYDQIFFTNQSWTILRDSGFITSDYQVKVRLDKLRFDEIETEIYPVRDII